MEMIDILNKLREYEKAGHQVGDAIKGAEMTQPLAVSKADKMLNTPAYQKMKDGDPKYADKTDEGGMSDIHIGAKDVLDSYTNEDGDLKMPKADVMKAMANEKDKAAFPRSYEIETAMNMVRDDFNDDGERNPEVEANKNEDSVAETMTRQHFQLFADTIKQIEDPSKRTETAKMVAGAMAKSNPRFDRDKFMQAAGVNTDQKIYNGMESKPDFLDMDKDGNKKEPMKQAIKDKEVKKETVKEAIQMSADTPEEASVLMQILKLAGLQQVTPAMMGAEQPAQDAPAEETYANEPNEKTQSVDDLVNTHSGGLNRQKIQVMKGYPGDNELAAEDIANSLRTQYESYKESYQAEVKKAQSPYAIGMAQAMKSTGDKPPLEKSTIKKAHDIAKTVEKSQK